MLWGSKRPDRASDPVREEVWRKTLISRLADVQVAVWASEDQPQGQGQPQGQVQGQVQGEGHGPGHGQGHGKIQGQPNTPAGVYTPRSDNPGFTMQPSAVHQPTASSIAQLYAAPETIFTGLAQSAQRPHVMPPPGQSAQGKPAPSKPAVAIPAAPTTRTFVSENTEIKR
jgi:hypothetical protein